MRAIRPFVNFNYDLRKKLSPTEKAKITRYFNYLRQATNDNTEIYRPRNAQNLEVAKEYANVKGSEWKAIPLKKSVDNASVRIRNGKITFDAGPLGFSKLYLLDQEALVVDGPEPALELAEVPKKIKPSQRYMILTDGNDFNGTFKKYKFLVAALEDMHMKYIGESDEISWRIDVQIISYQNASKEAINNYMSRTKREQRTRQERKRRKRL